MDEYLGFYTNSTEFGIACSGKHNNFNLPFISEVISAQKNGFGNGNYGIWCQYTELILYR